MPGNEIGDRVHNFFPQGNLPQELHLSPALGSNWPVSSDSPWAGNQRQVSLGSSNVKNYNLQQPDGSRGQIGNHLHGQNDFPQLTLRPEFGNNQSPAQPSNVNGFWDRDTNHNHHNLGSRGLVNYGSQQTSSPENQTKSSVRVGNPGSSLGFDLFGGQQQPMNNQQLSMLQSLRHQLSGNDMQQLQQQVMFMKMQELQRQQQLQQVDVQQQQNAMNHIPSFSKHASGSHFLAMNNGSQSADGSSNNLANEQGTNRLQRSSPSLQGSSYMLAFSPNHSPAQSAVDVPKQNEQSLYGVPVSGSRGVPNQYSHMTTDNRPAQQQASFGNAILGNQFNAAPSQLNAQNGNSFAKQRFQVENSFGSASGQAASPARVENFQQQMQRNSPQEEFHRMQRDVVQDNLLDTTEMQNTSSQADVALDPTEERILFGSDDNIWSAFGKSQEDGNAFDGGAFSALMQSAVAETSGGDSGLKEEGSGLNFQLGNEHVRASNDGGRQSPFAGGNSAMSSSLKSGFGTGSNDTNMNKNYQKVLGFQQFGGKSHPGSGQVLHANSPQGLGHSSQEGGQWSNGIPAHNFLAEASMVHRNSAHSLDSDFGKNVPGSWRPENLGFQRTPSKQDGGDAFGSVTNYRDGDVMVHGEGNSLQHPWGNDRAQAMQREVPHVGAPWTLDSAGDPNAQVKLSGRNAQVNNDGFGENNHSKILDSSTMRTGQGISSSYPINNWKFVDPLVNSQANETVRNLQHDNAPLYNDPSKGNEMENSDNQENSNDSRRSSLSHHASAGGQRKNVYSDAIDSRTQSATMHKYNQTDLMNSAPQKSHYPMGDLGDVEPSRGMKQPLHSQSMSHFSQPKFFGQMPNNFVEMGKGQPLDNQRSTKAFNEALSHPPGSVMASVPNMPSPFNRIGDTKATNMASMSSQNMLELLHKVDQSGGEHCPATRTSSSHPSSSSELPPAEKSDGSVGQLQRSLSSHSQGFSLQLGPPQRHSIPNQALTSSQNFMQGTNSTHSVYGAVDTGHDGSSSSVPASVHIMPNSKIDRPGVLGQLGNDVHKVPGNFNSSFHSRDQVQTLETVSGSGQASRSSEKEALDSAQKWDPHVRPSSHPSAETSLPNEAGSFLDNNASSGNASVEYGANLPDKVSATLPIPGSLPTSIAGLTSQGPSKALSGSWTNIVAQQHLLGHQFRKHLPQSFQTMRVNSDSLAFMNQLDQDNTIKREAAQTEFANGSANTQGYGGPEEEQSIKGGTPRQQVWPEYTNLAQKENASHGKMAFSPAHSDGAPVNSLYTQSDIEAFGRSLKPNHFQQNLSMLNPMRGMPVLDKDPSQLIMRGMKGQNDIPGVQLVAPMARLPDDCSEMASDATVPLNSTGHSGDTNINFSGPTNNSEKNPSLEHGNAISQGLLAFGHMISQGSNDSGRQMAPSLFNQYEAFRNDQISSLSDSHRGAIAKPIEQPLSAVDIGVNEVACIQQSAPLSCMEHVSSQILPNDVGDQHPAVLSAKKRKSVASEPIPWCKEVSQGSGNLQTISMAEVEWSKAVNRMSQKVEEDVEFLNDGPPFIRSKRRLILTTQLMQQLLRPPPPAILSMDANSDYESVAYSVSRLALGEACNIVAPTNEESNTSTDGMNRVSGECKTSDQYILKAAEAFTARARKLESDFSRVCKGASLVDMFVDYQDVEKFSTINRFAKFYGRGQAENSETASSSSASDAATAANMQQILCTQRYVTALPLPRSLPTGVQCHSL